MSETINTIVLIMLLVWAWIIDRRIHKIENFMEEYLKPKAVWIPSPNCRSGLITLEEKENDHSLLHL